MPRTQLDMRAAETFIEVAQAIRSWQQAGGLRTRLADRGYGIKRFLPLARRRAKILRPFLSAMRARNPWVLLRLMRLGLYVLCIALLSN